MKLPVGFKGTADQAPGPLSWFRDEDGIEWAGPHTVADEDSCPWGFCSEMDFRDYELVLGASGQSFDQSVQLKQPEQGYGPGQDRPFCHTVDGDSADWDDFVSSKTFVKEIV